MPKGARSCRKRPCSLCGDKMIGKSTITHLHEVHPEVKVQWELSPTKRSYLLKCLYCGSTIQYRDLPRHVSGKCAEDISPTPEQVEIPVEVSADLFIEAIESIMNELVYLRKIVSNGQDRDKRIHEVMAEAIQLSGISTD